MATAPKTTRISDDTTQAVPQTTAAGDAPADTYDPLERVSSAQADKAAAAAAGYESVNAVEPVDSIVWPTATTNRVQTVTSYDGKGDTVSMVLNYDKGTSGPVTTHAVSTAVASGRYIVEGGKVYEVTTAGNTAAAKPTFNAATVGATITDGTAVWTRRS